MDAERIEQNNNDTSDGEDDACDVVGQDGDSEFEQMSLETALIILARDGLDQPIENLEVQVELPDGTISQGKTTAQGVISVPPPKSTTGEAKVQVRGKDGQMQQVCTIDLAHCQGAAIIRSPKIAAPLKLKPHQQKYVSPSPTNEGDAWWEANGALAKAWVWLKDMVHSMDALPPKSGGNLSHVVKESANKAGNPIIVAVGPECPNNDNLRLGRNNIYREAITKAAKRVGIIPQAVAALIDAEAAKKTEFIPVLGGDGKPLINKKTGKPKTQTLKEQWNKDSYNASSRAAGLTQFLESTWLAHCLKSGYYVNEQSVAKGWVKKEVDAKGRSATVFVLAGGKTTPQPWKHTADANVQACLKERFTPEWSIMAAVDYGKANLAVLQKAGFKLAGLNDAEKAKLMYLMHHEGEGAGPLFIRNELSKLPKGKFASAEERLKHVFKLQVGAADAEKWAKRAGGVQQGYRLWLSKYINDKFDDLGRFACDSRKITPPQAAIELFDKIS